MPEDYVIQTALNMDTDTAESIIAGLPNILAAVTAPLGETRSRQVGKITFRADPRSTLDGGNHREFAANDAA